MVVDTSAIMAVIFDEDDAEHFADKLARAQSRLVSAATVVEVAVVLTRRTKWRDDRDLTHFLDALPITIVALDEEQAAVAREAYVRFGQASGHPASLNFGDCFSYSLAKSRHLPLLFKGDDFVHTDIERA